MSKNVYPEGKGARLLVVTEKLASEAPGQEEDGALDIDGETPIVVGMCTKEKFRIIALVKQIAHTPQIRPSKLCDLNVLQRSIQSEISQSAQKHPR